MSYDDFENLEVGYITKVYCDFGFLRFVKITPFDWLVEMSVKCSLAQPYVNFAQSLKSIPAYYLFDKYSK